MTWRRKVRLEVAVSEADPHVPSVTSVYPTADWQERETWDLMRSHVAAEPELGLGGPSLHWLNEALREMLRLSWIPAPAVPALAFVGSEEAVVDPARIHRFDDQGLRIARADLGQLAQGHEAIADADRQGRDLRLALAGERRGRQRGGVHGRRDAAPEPKAAGPGGAHCSTRCRWK